MEGSTEHTRHSNLRDSSSGPWSLLFGALGGAAIFGGGVLAFASQIGPDMGWIARSLGRIGIESGAILGSGVLSLGVSALFRQLHRMNTKLAAAEESVERTEFLSLAMRQLNETMTIIHGELCDLKDRQIATLQAAQEGNASEAVGMQVDATFRLASSIDQLGANFESRSVQQAKTLLDSIEQLSESITEKQEELCSLLEDAIQDQDDRWPDFEGNPLNAEPRLGDSTADCAGEFDVEVELEGWEEIAETKIDVSAFDWDAVKIPEAHRKTDLGMLDMMDDVDAPLPSAEIDSPEKEGLGLLDQLSEDGRPIEPEEEPPSLVRGKSIPLKEAQKPSGFQDSDLEDAWDVFNETEQD